MVFCIGRNDFLLALSTKHSRSLQSLCSYSDFNLEGIALHKEREVNDETFILQNVVNSRRFYCLTLVPRLCLT